MPNSVEAFRFDVAFSFAGSHRDKVLAIAELVAANLGKERVFFDEWYEHEILGADMDVLLQRFYHKESLFVVADLSDEYAGRQWCLAEARAIRALRFEIDTARDETQRLRMLNTYFAPGDVPGVFKTEAYLDGIKKTAEQCADLILKRLALLRQRLAQSQPATSTAQLVTPEPSRFNLRKVEFVYVPAGSFSMGTHDRRAKKLVQQTGRQEFDDEAPRTEVALDAFYIARYPLTNAQYHEFIVDQPGEPVPYRRDDQWSSSYSWDQVSRRFPEGLEQELRHELLAYKSFDLSDQSDFDTVSAHLGVPPSLLRHALREKSDAEELIYKQLHCTVEPTTIVKDIQTRLSLWIDNPSDVDLGQLRVQVRGPSNGMEVNPDRVRVQLAAKSRVHADFSVAATREGEFVLEVLFLDADVDALRDMLPMQQLWITSVTSEQQTGHI